MKPAIIALSAAGIKQAEMLRQIYGQADIFVPPRLATEAQSESGSLQPFKNDFFTEVAGIFRVYREIIFISAVAVAVRAIAPCLVSKAEDPAVVVVDEKGQFAISLLSGHLGGANELTGMIASCFGAIEVITTATDGRGLPAFDDLARKWGWTIENLPDLKKISAALLEGLEIVLYSQQPFNLPLEGNIYRTTQIEELSRVQNGAILISNRTDHLSVPTGTPQITLRPRNVAAGLGCRRGISADEIIEAVRSAFFYAGLALESLNCLASGEFKADEVGLIEAARYFDVPFKIFKGAEIQAAMGESLSSAFVEEQVGVGAVAEPCAVLGSGGGEIVLPVRRGGGITVSLAEGELF